MNRQEYFNDIVSKFNTDENHPALSPIERSALQKIKGLEKNIIDMNDRINTLVNEINERNREISDINNQIARERGRSEGVQEMLISTME